MSESIIFNADLSRIDSNLHTLARGLDNVAGRMGALESALAATHAQLLSLAAKFQKFVEADQKIQEVQLAETRLVKVRQELQDTFGHYDVVRRHTVGILQAADVSLVPEETMRTATEELMLAAPRYWLAPALVSMAAWMADNKALADRAAAEALRRDSEKSCLFFAMVARRAARFQTARTWLERYFSLQNPNALERELVIVLDAFVSGVFGPDADGMVIKRVQEWIEELSQRVGFVEEQQRQWTTALESKSTPLPTHAYPYLHQYSRTWPSLQSSLEGAQLHDKIYQSFDDIFSGEVRPITHAAEAVDSLLDKLVGEFDEEELPLRQSERYLNQIIEAGGDKQLADMRYSTEATAFDEKTDFTQRLTNWSVYAERSGASRLTQRFATALSKEWVIHAHSAMTTKNRSQVPLEIDLRVDQWRGVTRDGSEEATLLTSFDQHVDQRLATALDAAKQGFIPWAALVAGVGIAALSVLPPFKLLLLLVGGAGIVYWYINRANVKKARERLVAEHEELREKSKQIIRALCAEVVDYRRQYAAEDAKAERVREFLVDLKPEQCIQHGPSGTQFTVAPMAGEHGLASCFPSWDVLPVVTLVRRRSTAV